MNQLPSTIARECRYQQWAQDVHDCRNSGLSVPEWCEQHHLGVKSYYYRLKKVRSMLIEENPEIVKLVPENFSSTPSGADNTLDENFNEYIKLWEKDANLCIDELIESSR